MLEFFPYPSEFLRMTVTEALKEIKDLSWEYEYFDQMN